MNFTTTLEIGAKDCKICPYHWLLPAQVGCDHIHCDVVKQWMPHPLPSNISKAEIRLFNQFQNNVLLTLLNHVRDGKEKQRIRTRVHTIFCQGSRDDESPLVEECYARAQFELMQLITGGEINSENRRNSKSNSPHPHKSAKRRRSSSPVVGSFSPLRNDEDEDDNEDERQQFANSSFHHDNDNEKITLHGHQTTPTKKQKQQKKKKTTNQEEDSIYDDDDDNNDNANEKRKRKKNESVIEDQLNHSNSNSSNISALLNTSTDSIQHNHHHHHHSHNRRSSSVDPSHHPIVSDVIDLTIHHDFDELLDMTTEDMILPTTTTETTATKSNNSSKYHLKNFLKHASLSSIREFIIYANDEDILRMNDYLMQYSNDSARPRSDIISIVKHCIDIIRWIVSKNVQFLPYGILSLLTCSGQTIEGKYLQEFFTDTEHGRELLLKKRVELPAMPRIVRKREARDDMVRRGEEEDDDGEEGDDDASADASGTSVLLLEPLLRYNNGQFSEEMSKMCRILRKFVLDAHNFKRKQSKVQLRVKREAIEHLSSQHQPTQQHQTQQLYDDSGAGAVPPIDFNQLFNMFNSNSMEMMDPPQPTQPTAATAETTGQ